MIVFKKFKLFCKKLLNKLSINSKTAPWVVVAVVFIVGAGLAYYYRAQAEKAKSDPAAIQKEKNQAESDRVITALKESLLINEEDKPTVARIEDPEKLKETNKDFYKDIVQGDYLIIFPKRAIIYRESSDQVINVAPIVNPSDIKSNTGTTPTTDSVQIQ